MLLPTFLYVTLVIVVSLLAAALAMFILHKIIPRSGLLRSCLGALLAFTVFVASVFAIGLNMPMSRIILAGPGDSHSSKTAVFSRPAELLEKYHCSDFQFNKTYVVNCSDRRMLLYPVKYGHGPAEADTATMVDIPPMQFTAVGFRSPDFFFREPSSIQVKQSESGSAKTRWILDYAKFNP